MSNHSFGRLVQQQVAKLFPRWPYLPSAHRLGPILLSIYIGLGPVYRLPGLEEIHLRVFKGALFVTALALVLLPPLLQGRLRIPAGLLGAPGFIGLVILSLPGLVQVREPSLAFSFVLDIGFGAVFLWCFYWLARQGEQVGLILVRALWMAVALAAIHGGGALWETSGRNSFCEWGLKGVPIFGARPAGWSIGLSLFLPVALLLPVSLSRLKPVFGTGGGVALSSTLAISQFISGGRTGILASLISLAVLAFPQKSRWISLAVLAGVVIVGVVLFDESCVRHLSLERLGNSAPAAFSDTTPQEEELDLPNRLNAFSAGRLRGFWNGWERIREKPFLGHGLEGVLVEGTRRPWVEIHNLWIKWAVYCGILAPLLFAIMVGAVFIKGIRLWVGSQQDSLQKSSTAVLILIVVAGIVATMLEPNALIGSFQYTAVWWAAAGTILGTFAREKDCSDWLVSWPDNLWLPGGKSKTLTSV